MPPEMFHKKAVHKNFELFTRKILVSKFLLNKVAGHNAGNFIKMGLMFSCEYWNISKNTYFEENLYTVASE